MQVIIHNCLNINLLITFRIKNRLLNRKKTNKPGTWVYSLYHIKEFFFLGGVGGREEIKNKACHVDLMLVSSNSDLLLITCRCKKSM